MNTYTTSDLCRPRLRTHHLHDPWSPLAITRSGASVDLRQSTRTSPVLDAAVVTCLTARTTLRLLVVLSAAAHAVLLTVMMTTVIAPGANPTFPLTMPCLNTAASSCMGGRLDETGCACDRDGNHGDSSEAGE